MSVTDYGTQTPAPKWQPIKAIDRRVLGVLVEKAKTTPDTYPLSLNALVTGCNQKNNRHPLTQYESDQVEESLDRLRQMGAVAAVQGSGRVGKYRHYMYEWLGVDKVELAVMAELLLRGAQTEGELRGRAARMDPIPDLTTLRTVMDSLKAKGLVQALTPEGRGQIVSHALYLPEELEKLRRQIGAQGGPSTPATSAATEDEESTVRAEPRAASPTPSPQPQRSPAPAAAVPANSEELTSLRREVGELRAAINQLREDLTELTVQSQRNSDEIDSLRQALGG